jgi:hypothetical protein
MPRGPSHTTWHTGPHHSGSAGLSLCVNLKPGEVEIIENMVAQGLLHRRV